MRPLSTQAGFGPVEMLVGLAIGLLLVMGISEGVSRQRLNARVQEELSRMEDAGRFALYALGRSIRQAGFRPNDSTPGSAPFATDDTFQEGAVIGPGGSGNASASTLSLRYWGQSDGTQTNCLGVASKGTSIQTEQWRLGQASLQCTALGTTQPLVPSVEDLRFTLGLDNDGDGNAEQQLTPAAVPNWANVVSVRVYLRLQSGEDGLTESPQPYEDADGRLVTPGDRRLRRAFTATVSVRQSRS